MWDRVLNRVRVLSRPGVGTLVVSARRWPPHRISSVRFSAQGYRSFHEVPEPVIDDVLSAGSFEEVMALIRSASPKG